MVQKFHEVRLSYFRFSAIFIASCFDIFVPGKIRRNRHARSIWVLVRSQELRS